MHFYSEHLFFEVGGQQDGDKELIISALGEKEHFDTVYKLVDSAPIFEKWKIIALKPPVSFEDRSFKSDYYGVELNTSKMFFIPLDNRMDPDLIGLRVLVDNLDESKHGIYREGILMIINTILGEKIAAENISYVEVVRNDGTEDPISITDLPEYVEWKKSKAKN